jgi:2'-5' RNA ligase
MVGARLEKRLFAPHVTLYRGCTEPPTAPTVLPAITLAYEHFSLFETQMGRQGVSYHALADWALQP